MALFIHEVHKNVTSLGRVVYLLCSVQYLFVAQLTEAPFEHLHTIAKKIRLISMPWVLSGVVNCNQSWS